MSSGTPVYVTRSVLPSFEEYERHIEKLFESRCLTNHGELERQLTLEIRNYLEVPAITLAANGTLALQLAIRALALNGKKVITTPFTYVATVTSLLWEGCEPVFADIDDASCCIDPEKVAALADADPEIAGILPVHVYGNACDVRSLELIAEKHGLKILYDAAHAFGSELDGKSLFSFGDAAAGSFHATKLFHTIEGGCVASSPQIAETVRLLGAFGHLNDDYLLAGINAKMCELHAAMGLSLLPMVPDIIRSRKRICDIYDEELAPAFAACLRKPLLASGLSWNCAFYPVIADSAERLDRIIAALEKEDIHPRRYFGKSMTELPYLKGQSCPIAESLSRRVACLPLWADMPDALARRIAGIINSNLA